MSEKSSFGRINLDVTAGRERDRHLPEPDTPFRIAILGDFSGRANRGLCETGDKLVRRRIIAVDRDNFGQVLAKLGVQVTLPFPGVDGARLTLKFADMEDFHPDRLFESVKAFDKLRELRKRLADPSSFAAAAAELGALIEPQPASALREPTPREPACAPEPAQLVSGSLLEEMIQQAEGGATEAAVSRPRDEFSEYLRRIVAPHLVPEVHPRQPELVAQVDEATGSLMRAVLHHPDFQALEAAWRSVFFLVQRIETDVQLKLFLIDISKAELAADLNSEEDLRLTGIYKLLVEQTVETPGAEPWAVVAGDYTFDWTREDTELLGRMARVAWAAGSPFLAPASPRVLGCESLHATPDPRDWDRPEDTETARAWEALRKLPQARYLALAIPRFLLRLPYGKATEPTEHFDFEEMPDPPAHECYLWGNPAFACVLLLAQAFRAEGWNIRPAVYRQIDGLPLHVYKQDGETVAKPCAEVLPTERAIEAILDYGIMPLVSIKDRDAVRLIRFQSITEPLSPLAGRWG